MAVKRATRTVYRTVKAKRRGKKGLTVPIAVLAGFAPMLSYAYSVGWKQDGFKGFSNQLVYTTTGYDAYSKRWSMDGLKIGLVPIAAGVLVHKMIGGKLGVNRALANAGVPFLRL